MTPAAGDVVWLGRAASVQFAGERSLLLRVTGVDRRPTYEGWCWLTGYVLDEHGAAVERRQVYVQAAGIRPAPARAATPRPSASRPVAPSRPAGQPRRRRRPVDLALL